MKLLVISIGFFFCSVIADAATVGQFLPWLAPNSLGIGTSFAEFRKIRPEAVDYSGKSAVAGSTFEGGLLERLPDGSFFAYSFSDDQLTSVSWGVPASADTGELLLKVRKSLRETCGEPSFGTTGRIRSEGGVARISWEDYRSHLDQDYRITLRATSESGIDVHLIDEVDAERRGIGIRHKTFEEVVRSLPAGVSKEEVSEGLIDFVEEARAGRLVESTSDAGKQRRRIDGTELMRPDRRTDGKAADKSTESRDQADGARLSDGLLISAAIALLALAGFWWWKTRKG